MRGLAAIGIDTATTAVSTKFAVPASVLTGLTAPLPPAYLLSVRETLAPQTLLSRIRTVVRRATGPRD